jgi:hypothetical protein
LANNQTVSVIYTDTSSGGHKAAQLLWPSVALLIAFLVIYLPDVGHGFVRDDFMWVGVSRVHSAADVLRIARDNTGFYRPIVTLTFAADYAAFGLRPLLFALTNCALLLLCALLVGTLARRLGAAPWAALAAAGLWALNFHGVNMALLWISGRTALLLCLFALLATLSSLGDKWWQAAGWYFLALLSKEEAITLPIMLVGWAWYVHPGRPLRKTASRAVPLILATVAYLLLRVNSGAFGPADAPSYYQFVFQPRVALRNALEYADRAVTFSALAVAVGVVGFRGRPRWTGEDTRMALFATLWLVLGFAITVFLPVRSSLYALCPSIGAALLASRILQRLQESAPSRARYVLGTLLVLPFLLVPVYRQRNQRWVRPADVSRVLVEDLRTIGQTLPPRTHLVALETADHRLDYVFSGLFTDAVSLYASPTATGEVIPLEQRETWNTLAANTEVVRVQLGANGHFHVEP